MPPTPPPAEPASAAITAQELTEREAVIARMDRWATLMDTRFRIPFTPIRFGIDPLLALVPGLGTALGALLSAYIFKQALHYRTPPAKLAKMVSNIGVEFAIGLVPVLGAAFDVYWRANVKNVDLLRAHITPAATAREQRKLRALRLRQFGVFLLVVASLALVIYLWRSDAELFPGLRGWFNPSREAAAAQGAGASFSSLSSVGSQVLVPLRMF